MTQLDGGREVEQNFARNIKARREAAGLTQDQLAQRMAEHGFRFGQATVWKIESGQRQVSLAEALALSEALTDDGGYPPLVEWISQAPPADRARRNLEKARVAVVDAERRIIDAVDAYLNAIEVHAFMYSSASDLTAPEERTGIAWVNDLPSAPEIIALEARLRHTVGRAAAGNLDQVGDLVNAFEDSLKPVGWEWSPVRPEDIVDAHSNLKDGE